MSWQDFLERNTAGPSTFQDVEGLILGSSGNQCALGTYQGPRRTDWRLELVWLPRRVQFSETLELIHINFTFTQFSEEEA